MPAPSRGVRVISYNQERAPTARQQDGSGPANRQPSLAPGQNALILLKQKAEDCSFYPLPARTYGATAPTGKGACARKAAEGRRAAATGGGLLSRQSLPSTSAGYGLKMNRPLPRERHERLRTIGRSGRKSAAKAEHRKRGRFACFSELLELAEAAHLFAPQTRARRPF